MLWLRTAAAQRARKLKVAVAIALQSVNNKEASNANFVNERCEILRSLNRVFVFEIVLCIGAPSKDPARFVDLGFWILRNKEAHEYKSSSQETNHNTLCNKEKGFTTTHQLMYRSPAATEDAHGGGPSLSTTRPTTEGGPAAAQTSRPERPAQHQHSTPDHGDGPSTSTTGPSMEAGPAPT